MVFVTLFAYCSLLAVVLLPVLLPDYSAAEVTIAMKIMTMFANMPVRTLCRLSHYLFLRAYIVP